MRQYLPGILFVFAFVTTDLHAQSTNKETKNPPSTAYLSDPAISPDGSEIAFVTGGDIWTVPATGGAAHILIARAGYDSRPVYSPDGEYLAFTSTLTGNGDIYTYHFKTGNTNRITYDDAPDEVSSWSPDSKFIYFASSTHDISGMRDVYKIKTTGGSPISVTATRYLTEYFAAPSPDGKTIAFNARGMSPAQWWRKGHSHIDESEIWLLQNEKTYTQLTKRGAKDLWPMWRKDGSGLYFVSDRTGTQNLWFLPIKGEPKQLTKFSDGRVLWPTISANGSTITFEKDFGIWKFNITTSVAEPIKIQLMGSTASNGLEHLRLNSQFRELAVSPDGKKIAFTAHGEVFVTASHDGGSAFKVTNTAQRESMPTWTANSNNVIYVSERDEARHLYEYNFLTATETQLTNSKLDDGNPTISPDGKSLAYVRNHRELHIIDLATKKDILVTSMLMGMPSFPSSAYISWSPDNKWLALFGFGVKLFANVYLVPATENAKATQVSFIANSFGGNVNWGGDGKYILFATGQRTEQSFIARVDLIPQTPVFREEQFQKMFVDQITTPVSPAKPGAPATKTDTTKKSNTDTAGKAATAKAQKKSISITVEGLRERLNLLPFVVDVREFQVSRDGKKMLVSAMAGDQNNIYVYSLDETDDEPATLKQITTSPGSKSDVQFSADGKEIFYIERGTIFYVSVDSKMSKPVSTTAELDVDFNKEKVEVFNEVWETQSKGFYDENFHGADWNKIRGQYRPLAQGATTPDELRRLLNLMVGELNASHSGVSGPPTGGAGSNTGKLGLIFNSKEYESTGRFKVDEVIFMGPAYISDSIKVGDYLVSIDGKKLEADDNLDQLLQNKAGKRIILSISSNASGAAPKKVSVNAGSLAAERGLLYKQWVKQERDYVTKISNGKLGYVHMPDMTAPSLNQLYVDLDEENQGKQGIVIDIRNNNGGFVNAYALDVITRKPYLTMTGRGMPSAPGRTQLGQRAIETPTVLVTNQHSLSDAEDFTEGYRTMGLGKVVGEPTAGWIVFTSSAGLIDGGAVRLPFIKITDNRGQNMELNPRPVDIPVTRMIGETNDSQLDAAVKQLLSEVGGKK